MEQAVRGSERVGFESLITPYGAVWLATVALMAIGAIWVLSASFPQASQPDKIAKASPYQYLAMHLASIAVALAIMAIVPRLSERAFKALAHVILATMVAGMVWAALWGQEINGARAWLFNGRLQPSELAKVSFAICAGYWLGRRRSEVLLRGDVIVFMLAGGTLIALLFLQSDLGMAAVVLVLMLGMLYLNGLERWRFVGLLATVLAVGAGGVLSAGYRIQRIIVWRDPYDHLDQGGRHLLSCKLSIARGALFGQGLGESTEKWIGLSYPHTDSIFAVIVGEGGLVMALLLLAAYGWLLVWALQIGMGAAKRSHFLIASSCGLLIASQALINVAAVSGAVPFTGLTLPFVSYGGSSMVAMAYAAAAILWVARQNLMRPAREIV